MKTFQQVEQTAPDTVAPSNHEEKRAQKLNQVLVQIKELYQNNGNQPIPYYKLIIDPNDFMITVDNAFQVSFLFRDKHLFMMNGEDGFPAVRIVEKREKDENTDNLCQFVSTLQPAFVKV